ncbi:MAG: hypothetical protein Q8L37_02690 [Candidatus Gottesmanbacteria bacterium]|nr:hypothetical protein [Candidatus Gottesmanbacteria bacterium]
MLTFKDLQEIEELIHKVVKDLISHLPSKDDFYTRMDMLSKEIKDAREELAAHSISHDRLTENDEELEKRVSVVEKKVGAYTMNN